MSKNIYHIRLVHLKSFERGNRTWTHDRIISSFEDIDKAVDYFMKVIKQKDPTLNKAEENEILEGIYDDPESLLCYPFNFWLREFRDYETYYVGPGGYVIEAAVLQ